MIKQGVEFSIRKVADNLTDAFEKKNATNIVAQGKDLQEAVINFQAYLNSPPKETLKEEPGTKQKKSIKLN